MRSGWRLPPTTGNAPAPPAGQPPDALLPIHWPRTLAARGAGPLQPQHLRPADRPPGTAALHCFVLDCSASMLAGGQLAQAKGVLAQLLQQAYQQRAWVAVLGFGGHGTVLHQPPGRAQPGHIASSSPLAAPAWLPALGGGGGTPLAAALHQANALLARHTHGPRWLWLLSDGRTLETPPRPTHAEHLLVIDFETARPPLGRSPQLARQWNAAHWPAAALWQPPP